MSPEDELHSPPLGFSSTRDDGTLSCGDLAISRELGGRSKTCNSSHTRTPEADINCFGDSADGKSPFLKTLMDAEAAANSAAIQLVSFKDAMEDEFSDSKQSAIDKRRITRQRGLLLEKLENFRRINKSVRQKLKQLQDAEAYRIDADKKTDILLKRITQAESEKEHLKRHLSETERKIEDMMNLRREDQENIKSAVQVNKSVEATRAHLQGQLRNKEAENNRLTVQLRTVERTMTEQKMEIDDLKASIPSLSEKAAKDKDSLKKACRAQKQRAERFEAAIEKCYTQMREKDAQIAKARLERDSRRQQKEQESDERDKLVVQIEVLKSQVKDMTARLRMDKEELTAANETVMQRVEKLSAENGDLHINNTTLKVSVAKMEQQLAESESALIEEKVLSQESKHQAAQCQSQVSELQAEDTEKTQDGKDTEVKKLRQELQGRVDKLERYPELLSAAEQSLFECQENLRRSERKCSEQSESVRQLQVKMESQTKLLTSSVEMKESIVDANSQLQETVNSLQKKMDTLQQENLELVRRLAAQEEDVRLQVNKVKDQAVSREETLQAKILELESEKSRRDNELRNLRQSKLTAEKRFEVRLKDLQLSLDQSESHKQSIQNYVDFLKNSYQTMFDEGLQSSCFESAYFLK
ncbi:Outer dense fiber protein 2 [Dissostichus eleginoides]|uniref:Outer dense fiber protein 2 n=1 Tax=Dissostichus eleginoides TaxID=100907 RepID=A0AAD9BB03_DISEL|nr:Outer dense fiber protein 2 [Dissostichus eleginoides]